MNRARLAIFGGTFDPIHNGHIKTSMHIQARFHFDPYYFVPCNRPILKAKASASNAQRIEMLQLALENLNEFSLNLQEIESEAPSYTVHTVRDIRRMHPHAHISFIMGFDSFLTLPQWHEWEEIIKLTNVLVMQRTHYTNASLSSSLQALLKQHRTEDKALFINSPSGFIHVVDAGQYVLSSTRIREALKQGKDLRHELPKKVFDYIQAHQLYR